VGALALHVCTGAPLSGGTPGQLLFDMCSEGQKYVHDMVRWGTVC
jgi:hypothetical protein